MKMTGEQRIAASRDRVWQALNDPEILRQCIPGCQSLDKEAEDRMKAVVEVKIGPIGARFNGAVSLSDLNPPQSYTITGEGHGGTVGTAKGGAKVQLAEDGEGTLLTYDVDAQVGGRLAQLGGPIIDATAKQLAAKFFRQFGELVGRPAVAAEPVAQTAAAGVAASPLTAPAIASSAPAPTPATGGAPIAWLLGLLCAALVGFLIGRASGYSDSGEWMGLAIGLLLVVVAGAAFEFGRRAAAPLVVLDAALLQRLTREDRA